MLDRELAVCLTYFNFQAGSRRRHAISTMSSAAMLVLGGALNNDVAPIETDSAHKRSTSSSMKPTKSFTNTGSKDVAKHDDLLLSVKPERLPISENKSEKSSDRKTVSKYTESTLKSKKDKKPKKEKKKNDRKKEKKSKERKNDDDLIETDSSKGMIGLIP